jgi:hypothetical protein
LFSTIYNFRIKLTYKTKFESGRARIECISWNTDLIYDFKFRGLIKFYSVSSYNSCKDNLERTLEHDLNSGYMLFNIILLILALCQGFYVFRQVILDISLFDEIKTSYVNQTVNLSLIMFILKCVG